MMGLELFLLIGVVAFLVWGAQQGWPATRRGASRPAASSALDILERRYAQGEIDRDEYLQRRALLEG